jgi:pimeloyl-ACP methyl ester carboxylesterase
MSGRVWLFGCFHSMALFLVASRAADTDWQDVSPHRSGFVSVNGVRLHFLDWGGQGEPVLLLHGLGDTAHIFDDFAPRLSQHFRVIGLTRRGHGQSGKPETGYDTATLVEDIRQFLDVSKIDRVVLIGHSIAGDELTRFATLHPERIVKLVYLDAAYDRARLKEIHTNTPPELSPGKEAFTSLDSFRRWLNRLSFWSPAWEANAREMVVLSSDMKIVREVKPAKVSRLLLKGTEESKPEYRGVRAPGLNLAAVGWSWKVSNLLEELSPARRKEVEAYLRRVEELKRGETERFRKEIPNGTVMVFTNTDHHCFIQREDEVLHHVQEFLRR